MKAYSVYVIKNLGVLKHLYNEESAIKLSLKLGVGKAKITDWEKNTAKLTVKGTELLMATLQNIQKNIM